MDMPPPILPGPSAIAAPIMPPPKRSRVVGSSKPPSSSTDATSSETNKVASNPKKPIGTLAFLSSMTKDSGKPANGKTEEDSKQDAKKKTVLDPKKDVWQAPKDQDGSGYTKLNAKFAGRY